MRNNTLLDKLSDAIGRATRFVILSCVPTVVAAAVVTVNSSSDASAQPRSLPALVVEQTTLSNGLKLILHVDRTTPMVSVNIWYHVGSKDEPLGRNGFAHLFEHLMFQGSKHVGEDQFFVHLEQAGASDFNGSTSFDRTNYYATVPSNQLELALWLESDRMGFLLDHVNQDTFENQRSVVLNERRQNYVDAPYGMVSQYIHEHLYPSNHPYHRLTIGSPSDLAAASLADVQAFYKTHYLPNNATLVLAGDIDPSDAKQLVEKYFGSIPPAKLPKANTSPTPVRLSGQTTINMEASVEFARVYIAFPTPPFFAIGDADLDGLSLILSEGQTSRLHKRLVYDLQIAKDVSARQESSQLASVFHIVATASAKGNTEALLKAIDEELDQLRALPPTEEEVSRVKANLESTLIFAIEQVGERADMFNTYAQLVGSPDYFSRDVERYRSITSESLHRASRTYLSSANRIVVKVEPNPGAPRSGRIVR